MPELPSCRLSLPPIINNEVSSLGINVFFVLDLCFAFQNNLKWNVLFSFDVAIFYFRWSYSLGVQLHEWWIFSRFTSTNQINITSLIFLSWGQRCLFTAASVDGLWNGTNEQVQNCKNSSDQECIHINVCGFPEGDSIARRGVEFGTVMTKAKLNPISSFLKLRKKRCSFHHVVEYQLHQRVSVLATYGWHIPPYGRTVIILTMSISKWDVSNETRADDLCISWYLAIIGKKNKCREK